MGSGDAAAMTRVQIAVQTGHRLWVDVRGVGGVLRNGDVGGGSCPLVLKELGLSLNLVGCLVKNV